MHPRSRTNKSKEGINLMAWKPTKVRNDAEREHQTTKKSIQYGKYCDDHTCFCDEDGECQKCKAGLPGYIRERKEINPNDKERMKDLENRGLVEEQKVGEEY